MKIIFMGTPDFAKESLQKIFEAGHEICAVVTNPDKPKGRGMKLAISPVKEYAIEKGLTIYQPQKIRKNIGFLETLKSLNPDVICVVAYGKILSKEILEIAKNGCINVHASLLPQYRGAAPIQWSVINGDKYTGVTTMYMDEGMDTGDMILTEKVEIGKDETTGELWDRLSKIGGNLLVETLEEIENGTAQRTKQDEDFSMAPMLDKKMAKIDWNSQTVEQIKNLVRGLNPIMGAYTFLDGKKIKFWKVNIEKVEDFEKKGISKFKNGTVVLSDDKEGLFIKGKNGIIQVLEIQGENSKRMKVQDFLRGNRIVENSVFE